jgi:putative oxidoreductase
MTYVLWIIQGLLALLFLFGGIFKLVAPIEPIAEQIGVPALLLRFVGLCEFFGGLGLVLPGIFRIRTGLTPLAAAGLVIITIGATVVTIKSQGFAPALFPLVTCVLCAFVVYGRWRAAPLGNR